MGAAAGKGMTVNYRAGRGGAETSKDWFNEILVNQFADYKALYDALPEEKQQSIKQILETQEDIFSEDFVAGEYFTEHENDDDEEFDRRKAAIEAVIA